MIETNEGKRKQICLLYTSDAADEEDSVDLGGRRIIKINDNELADIRFEYWIHQPHKGARCI